MHLVYGGRPIGHIGRNSNLINHADQGLTQLYNYRGYKACKKHALYICSPSCIQAHAQLTIQLVMHDYCINLYIECPIISNIISPMCMLL